MVFRGTFEHSLDAKNRLTIPAKFRPGIAGGAIVAIGVDQHLGVWLPEAHEKYVNDSLAGLHPLSSEFETLNDFFMSGADDVELDSAGRIQLRPNQLEYAGLTKDVVVTGAGSHFRIWDAAAWTQRHALAGQKVRDISAQLSGRPADRS